MRTPDRRRQCWGHETEEVGIRTDDGLGPIHFAFHWRSLLPHLTDKQADALRACVQSNGNCAEAGFLAGMSRSLVRVHVVQAKKKLVRLLAGRI